jgi:hypothetical protein
MAHRNPSMESEARMLPAFSFGDNAAQRKTPQP